MLGSLYLTNCCLNEDKNTMEMLGYASVYYAAYILILL